MKKKIVTLVCLCIIAVLAIGQIFTASRGFSEMENRYLSLAPELSWENLQTGQYMDGLEDYLVDHVPGRDAWVLSKNTLLRAVGRSQIGSVYFGKEERLIQVQDVSLEQLDQNMELIAGWIDQLPEDLPVDFLLAPNASWIYAEQLGKETQTYDPEAAAEVVKQALPERVRMTCACETLMEHKNEDIYFKSDHHWTMLGAAYAFEALTETMGLEADAGWGASVVMGQDFKGSVYSQAPVWGYPGENFEVILTDGLEAVWSTETESGSVLMAEGFEKKDQYSAFMGGNYGLTRIVNEKAESSEKLLILKDSYANILLPFLSEEYQEIIMVDLRYFRQSIDQVLVSEGIEHVIFVYNLDFLCTDTHFSWLYV